MSEVDVDVEAVIDGNDCLPITGVVAQDQTTQAEAPGRAALPGRAFWPPEGLEISDRARPVAVPAARHVPESRVPEMDGHQRSVPDAETVLGATSFPDDRLCRAVGEVDFDPVPEAVVVAFVPVGDRRVVVQVGVPDGSQATAGQDAL